LKQDSALCQTEEHEAMAGLKRILALLLGACLLIPIMLRWFEHSQSIIRSAS
jgi:hypothetical protein